MNSIEAKSIFELTIPERGRESVGRPAPAEVTGGRRLEVNVLCTSVPATVRAMERAVEFARGLNARVHLLVAQQVSYAAPLETPPVAVEFQEALFRKIAQNCDVEARVDIFLCRDAEQTFLQHLPRHSLVVLGSPKRWWPTREERMARHLRRSGHEVVVVYGKEKSRA
jgi:hypothetical protein